VDSEEVTADIRDGLAGSDGGLIRGPRKPFSSKRKAHSAWSVGKTPRDLERPTIVSGAPQDISILFRYRMVDTDARTDFKTGRRDQPGTDLHIPM